MVGWKFAQGSNWPAPGQSVLCGSEGDLEFPIRKNTIDFGGACGHCVACSRFGDGAHLSPLGPFVARHHGVPVLDLLLPELSCVALGVGHHAHLVVAVFCVAVDRPDVAR